LLSRNFADQNGGAIYVSGSCDIGLVNCTTSSNASDRGVNGLSFNLSAEAVGVALNNCILWDSGLVIWSSEESRIFARYSNIFGGWPGDDNIDADPLFADPAMGDYHLKSQAGRWATTARFQWVEDNVTSPCIDAGDPTTPIGDEPEPKRVGKGRIQVRI
jgi:predicted outer membrane repeat protein